MIVIDTILLIQLLAATATSRVQEVIKVTHQWTGGKASPMCVNRIVVSIAIAGAVITAVLMGDVALVGGGAECRLSL